MANSVSNQEQEPRIFFGRRIPSPELAKVMNFGFGVIGLACLPVAFLTSAVVKGFAALLISGYFVFEGGAGRYMTDAIRRVSPEQRAEADSLVRKVAQKKGMLVPSVTVADMNYYWPEIGWSRRFGLRLPSSVRIVKKRLMNAGAIQLVPNTRHPERKWLHFERRPSWFLSGHISRRFRIPLPVLDFLEQSRLGAEMGQSPKGLLQRVVHGFRSGVEMPSAPRLVRKSGQHAHHILLTTMFLDSFTPEEKEAVVDHELEHILCNHSFRRLTRQPLQVALSKGRLFLVYAGLIPAVHIMTSNTQHLALSARVVLAGASVSHAVEVGWPLLVGVSVANYVVRLVRMREQCRWENEADDGPLRDGYATPLADFFEAAKPNSLGQPNLWGLFKEKFVPPVNSHPPLRDRVKRARDYAAEHDAPAIG